MIENKLKVDIEGSNGKIVESFIISKMNVAASARRFALSEQISLSELPEQHKNQLLVCAALVTVLRNTKGDLIYPPPSEGKKDTGVDDFADAVDYDVFNILAQAYSEINPIDSGLKAKKKKY